MSQPTLQDLMMRAHKAWAARYPRKAYAAGYTKEMDDGQAEELPLQRLHQPRHGGERPADDAESGT